MQNALQLVKENKKSLVYENEKYRVKLIPGGIAFPPKRMIPYLGSDDPAQFDTVQVTNRETEKTAQLRMYQINPIAELEGDLKYKSQFKESIWNKID